MAVQCPISRALKPLQKQRKALINQYVVQRKAILSQSLRSLALSSRSPTKESATERLGKPTYTTIPLSLLLSSFLSSSFSSLDFGSNENFLQWLNLARVKVSRV